MQIVLVAALLLVPLLAVLLVKATRAGAEHRRRIQHAWETLAMSRDLVVLPAEPGWRGPPMRLTGRIEGVEIVLDTYTETTTGSSGDLETTTWTRLRGKASRPVDVKATVYHAHALSGVGKLLGFQDVETGDRAFDDTFVVKADDEARVRELLGPDLRRVILAFPKRGALKYDHGDVELAWTGHEDSASVLDAACDVAIAACAGRAATYR